jgi:RNA polymerase sigma-70 factor (ECF subfamily)
LQNVLQYNEKENLFLVSEGDEKAFELLYNEYQPRLNIYLLPFTGNSKEEAEEIIQDIFLKIWTRRETLPAIENFPSYLFRMARNRFLDGQKKRKDYLSVINEPQQEEKFRSTILEGIAFAEYSAMAREAIQTLSPQRRKVFMMRYEEDMSFDEIAENLQIARTTVKKQCYEAVHLVKDFLRQHGDIALFLIIAFTGIFFKDSPL